MALDSMPKHNIDIGKNIQEASFRRQISMNCLISETSEGMVGDVYEYAVVV